MIETRIVERCGNSITAGVAAREPNAEAVTDLVTVAPFEALS